MGMFDWILAPKIKCPKCSEILDGFQSKDGPCELEQLEYEKVENFYTSCQSCGSWISFKKKEVDELDPIPNYTMTHREKF